MWPFSRKRKQDRRLERRAPEIRLFYTSKKAEEVMGPIRWTMKDKCMICGRKPNVATVNRIANKNVGFPLCKEHRDEYPYIVIE